MNGKKAKAQRTWAKAKGQGQGYLRTLRKQDKLARQTQDSKSTTPPIGVKLTPKATGPKQHNQPNYGPVIDTRPIHNAKAESRMILATTAEPPLHWFDKVRKLLTWQGIAGRMSKPAIMNMVASLKLK